MEHINVKNLGNGMVKLTPDNGYVLIDNRSRRTYSEAVIRGTDVKYFRAVKI